MVPSPWFLLPFLEMLKTHAMFLPLMGNLGTPIHNPLLKEGETIVIHNFWVTSFSFLFLFSCRLLIVDYKHFFVDYELLLFPCLVIFSLLVTFAISYRSMKQAAFMGHFVFAFVLRFINRCIIFTSPCLLLDDSELYV